MSCPGRAVDGKLGPFRRIGRQIHGATIAMRSAASVSIVRGLQCIARRHACGLQGSSALPTKMAGYYRSESLTGGCAMAWMRDMASTRDRYYSQCGQDRLVDLLFFDAPPPSKIFVEVGAYDGTTLSNVRRLHEVHGWSGISIEPVAESFERLQRSYADTSVRCIRCAIGTNEGEAIISVPTFRSQTYGYDLAFSTMAPARQRAIDATWRQERVRVRRLDNLLAEHGIELVGFMSIDTEDMDLEVLQIIDFATSRPFAILVEYSNNRAAILRFLRERGYWLFDDNGQDLFMCRETWSI